jgi:chromosomal replication initiation ATPase DnaA
MQLINVLEGVCFIMGQDIERVKAKGRYRELVVCRHLFYYLSKYYYGAKLKDIGAITGVDHTSVIHGIQLINDLISIKEESIINAIPAIQDYISQRYQADKKMTVFVPYDVNLSEIAEMLQNTYRCRVIL